MSQSHSTRAEPSAPDDTRQRLLARIADVLACPDCKRPVGPAAGDASALECPHCGVKGRRDGDQFVLGGFTGEQLEADWLNRYKERAKRRLGRLYPLALRALSPVYGSDQGKRI